MKLTLSETCYIVRIFLMLLQTCENFIDHYWYTDCYLEANIKVKKEQD